MGAWGITERESDAGLDQLDLITVELLEPNGFEVFHVADAMALLRKNILAQIELANTSFAVKDGNGNVLATCTTGKDGTATVTGLIPGSTVVVVETRVPDGYVLNTTPQVITVKNGANTLTGSTGTGGTPTNPDGSTGTGNGNDLTFENEPKQTLTIHHLLISNGAGGVGFLPQAIADVLLAGQDVLDHLPRPALDALRRGDLPFSQFLLYLPQTAALQVAGVDQAHCLRLLRVDLRLAVRSPAIAQRPAE